MIPSVEILTQEITEIKYPSKTYKITFGSGYNPFQSNIGVTTTPFSEEYDRINGYVDEIDAVIQAVYLILSTERYEFLIYSWDYGVELLDLFGKPLSYVMAALPRRIKEALTQDDRIDDVTDFEFEKTGSALHTKFTVVSNVGNIPVEMEVEV